MSAAYRLDLACVVWPRALQTPDQAQTHHRCKLSAMVTIGKKFFLRDVHVPTAALREETFLQRSKSVASVIFSHGKLFSRQLRSTAVGMP